MNSKKKMLILMLVFALVIVGASVLYAQLGSELTPDQLAIEPNQTLGSDTQGTEAEEVLAPDFTVYDLNSKEVRLSDHYGKPIVVNFWASWCGPCQMEMPDFQEKFEELGDEVHFLMINMTDGSRETVESASDFIAQSGYTFPVFYDTQTAAAAAYGAYSLPMTFFIDAEGHPIARAVGAIDAATLQAGIDMAIEG